MKKSIYNNLPALPKLLYDFYIIFLNLLSLKTMLINHKINYENSNLINIGLIKKEYSRYRHYLIFLFTSIIVFYISFSLGDDFAMLTVSCLGIFIFLSSFGSIYFIFNRALLSKSKLFLLIFTYVTSILSFALFYWILYSLEDKSFSFNNINNPTPLTFLYFSIVTITTLGYGDISPISEYAQIMVSIEVLFSVVFFVFGINVLFSSKVNDKKIFCALHRDNSLKHNKT